MVPTNRRFQRCIDRNEEQIKLISIKNYFYTRYFSNSLFCIYRYKIYENTFKNHNWLNVTFFVFSFSMWFYTEVGKDRIMPFLRASEGRETYIALSRIWTRHTESIFFDGINLPHIPTIHKQSYILTDPVLVWLISFSLHFQNISIFRRSHSNRARPHIQTFRIGT